MKELHELKKKMMDELRDQAREIMKKPRMSAGDLDTINKLVKSIDRTCEIIEAEEEGGYSEGGMWRAEGDYGHSYAGRRRDSMGRYTRRGRGGNYSREGGYSRNDGDMYSMDDGLMEQLEEKMRRAKDSREREAIKRCIDVLRD